MRYHKSKFQEVIETFIRGVDKWSVKLHFSHDLYQKISKIPDAATVAGGPEDTVKRAEVYKGGGLPLPADPLEYLRREVKGDPEIVEAVWCMPFALFHFDTKREAVEFFRGIPEGSLVDAELYSRDGKFWEDNT